MSRVFTRADRELLEMLRNGCRQQDDFCIEPVVEETLQDDDWAGISA